VQKPLNGYGCLIMVNWSPPRPFELSHLTKIDLVHLTYALKKDINKQECQYSGHKHELLVAF